jgi:hypothetical protein
MKISYPILSLVLIVFISCQSNNTGNTTQIPENGDLTSTFSEQQTSQTPLTPDQLLEQEKNRLVKEGWQENNLQNGLMPSCYNFSPKYDQSTDNYLKINVGSGTDMVAKLMNANTGICVRYVFINRLSSYSIRNIPEGVYYLKLAYGKEWLSKVENSQCVGRFLSNPMYEKGSDLLDFNLIKNADGYSIPSYEISLDVVSSTMNNSFSTSNISEAEFNK